MEGAAAVAMHLAYEVKIADWRDAETGLCVVEHSLGVGFEGRRSKQMAYAGRGVYRAHVSSLGICGPTRRSDLSPAAVVVYSDSGTDDDGTFRASFQCVSSIHLPSTSLLQKGF